MTIMEWWAAIMINKWKSLTKSLHMLIKSLVTNLGCCSSQLQSHHLMRLRMEVALKWMTVNYKAICLLRLRQPITSTSSQVIKKNKRPEIGRGHVMLKCKKRARTRRKLKKEQMMRVTDQMKVHQVHLDLTVHHQIQKTMKKQINQPLSKSRFQYQ